VRNPLTILFCLVLLLAFASCQRVISIDVNPGSTLLVIEGNMTNIAGVQTVYISKTVSYSDANVYPPVSGATVTITNGTTIYPLKETIPGQYTASTIRVRLGQVYTLNVQADNKTYTASSVLPAPVNLDSIGISALSVGSKTVKTVSAFYHDPPTEKNQYRFVLYVNGVQVKQIFAVNDDLTNGRIINTTLYQSDITLVTGDKVEVEMQCIDGVYIITGIP
jgi:hypothetical protein